MAYNGTPRLRRDDPLTIGSPSRINLSGGAGNPVNALPKARRKAADPQPLKRGHAKRRKAPKGLTAGTFGPYGAAVTTASGRPLPTF